MRTSNFALKPVKLQVWRASPRDLAAVPTVAAFASQRTPAQFRQPVIRAERALRRDDSYRPQFTNVPIRLQALDIELSQAEHASLRDGRLDAYYGDDEGAMLRDVLFSWWETRYLG
jgi:hypothetical protein